MARNKIEDLNNHLFETLERLNDDELSTEELELAIKKAKATSDVAKVIIDNNRLALKTIKEARELGYNPQLPQHMIESKPIN